MKPLKNLLTILLILLPLSAYAWGVVVSSGGVAAPAVTNGEVGNKSGANSEAVSANTYPGNDQALSCCFSATASGTVRYIHIVMGYSSGTTGQQYNAAIYSADGTTLLGDGSLTSEGSGTPVQTTITLDSDVSVSSGTTYCLSFGSHNSSDGWSAYYTTQTGQTIYYDSTYTVGATMPANVDVTTVKVANSMLRIWATNTSDGS